MKIERFWLVVMGLALVLLLLCGGAAAAPTNSPTGGTNLAYSVAVNRFGVPVAPTNFAGVLMTNKGDLMVGTGTNVSRQAVGVNGYVLTADSTQSNGVKWAAAGAGTVTSVGLNAPSWFSVSGSPVTVSGTLALALANQTTNTFPTGGWAGSAPTWRALNTTDLPTGIPASKIAGGVVSDAEFGFLDGVTSGVQGQLDNRLALSGGTLSGGLGFSGTGHAGLRLNVLSEAERDALAAPADGMLIYDTDSELPEIYSAGVWYPIGLQENDLALMGRMDLVESNYVRLNGSTMNGAVQFGGATNFGLRLNNLTTAEREAIAAPPGALVYDATTERVYFRDVDGPTWRRLAALDEVVAASVLTAKGDILTRSVSGLYTLPVGGNGQVLSVDLSTASGLRWISAAGVGTVTSVGITLPPEMGVSGSPVTAAGVLAVTNAHQVANTVMAGPSSGTNNTPGYRTLVDADLPAAISAAKIADGSVDNAEFQRLNGGALVGTNLFTAKGELVVWNATNAVRVPAGTAGQVLKADPAQSNGVYWAASGGGGLIYAQTAATTVTNTTTETILHTTGAGSRTIAANTLAAGSTVNVQAWGVLSTPGSSQTAVMRLYVGSTAVWSVSTTWNASKANQPWMLLNGTVSIYTTGSGGTAVGMFRPDAPGTMGGYAYESGPAGTHAINTTIDNEVKLTVQFGTASGSSITCHGAAISLQ